MIKLINWNFRDKMSDSSPASPLKKEITPANPYKHIFLKFKLNTNETILRAAPAIYKKTITCSGHIFITQRYVLFYSKSFGRDIKEKIDLKDIQTIKEQDNELMIQLKKVTTTSLNISLFSNNSFFQMIFFQNQKTTYRFQIKGTEASGLIDFIKEIQTMRGTIRTKHQIKSTSMIFSSSAEDNFDVHSVLSESEWDLILKGANHVTFKKGDYIVKQGEVSQRINQISRGTARIEVPTFSIILFLSTIILFYFSTITLFLYHNLISFLYHNRFFSIKL